VWPLTDYEASFLRLLEKMTNGSTVEISYTGKGDIQPVGGYGETLTDLIILARYFGGIQTRNHSGRANRA
jgi:hypothetical protein